EKDGVKVGGQDLLVGDVAGRFAREQVGARQDMMDHRRAVALGSLKDNPVADGGKVRSSAGSMPQAPANPGYPLAVGGAVGGQLLVLGTARAGKEAGTDADRESFGPERAPAEGFQSIQEFLPLRLQ